LMISIAPSWQAVAHKPAAVAFIFVNMDDLPNHIYTLLLWVFFAFAASL